MRHIRREPIADSVFSFLFVGVGVFGALSFVFLVVKPLEWFIGLFDQRMKVRPLPARDRRNWGLSRTRTSRSFP